MASDALSGFLAGVEQGTRTGLALYQTIQGEKRARRQEAYQRERDAVADQQWESTFDEGKRRYDTTFEEGKRRYDTTFEETKRRYDETLAENRRQADQNHRVSLMNAQTNAGQLALANRKWDYAVDEDRRAKQEAARAKLFTAASVGEDGLVLSNDDPRLAQRLNSLDPGTLRQALVDSGIRTPEQAANYTDIRFEHMPGRGTVAMVQGTDATGKPIEGWKPLTAFGSSDPNDEIPVITANTLLNIYNPNFAAGQRAAALERENVEAQQGAVDAQVESQLRTNGADRASLAAIENELATKRAELAALTQDNSPLANTPTGKQMAAQMRGALESDIASLSHELARGLSTAQGIEAQRVQKRAAVADSERRARLSAGDGASYTAAVGTRAAKTQETVTKQMETREKTAKAIIAQATGGMSKKSMEEQGVNPGGHLYTQLMNNPEYLDRAASDPQARAALTNAAYNIVSSGSTGSLEAHLAASKYGVDPVAFEREYNDQALHGLPYEQRVKEALVKARRAAEGSSLSGAGGKAGSEMRGP